MCPNFGSIIEVKYVDCGLIRKLICKKIVLLMCNSSSGYCFDKRFKRECESL